MNTRSAAIACLLAALSLAGCDSTTTNPETLAAASVASTPATETRQTASDTMSYEVAIAIAAANRHHALRDCDARAANEREACRDEVESDWDVANAALADLRGDQG